MKLVFTEQSFESLESIKEYLTDKYNLKKAEVVRKEILDEAELLIDFSERGQIEEILESLNLDHRYILKGHTKIIYRIAGDVIYVTDFFDSRQDPSKMKG
jgi:toxin ParE1/3/4